jgi:tRNA-dihydrouridine synthase B
MTPGMPFAPLKVGSLSLDSHVFLAPMCGVCDRAYLEICRDIDPLSVLATEMVSAAGLAHGGRHSAEMVDFSTVSQPVMIQIFGHDETQLAVGSKLIQEAGADIISMNFGCPAKKIVNNCDGAALLRTPDRIGELVEACAKAVTIPMVPKMRLGWDEDTRNYITVARILQEAGAHAIAVHGRTRSQGYTGEADWAAIKEIVNAVDIPVIGNGDVTSPEMAAKRMRQTGVAGIMIGRAAMGNPWLIARTAHYLSTGELRQEPRADERVACAVAHIKALLAAKGERTATLESRKHVSWYTTGLPGSAELRLKINQAPSTDAMLALLAGYLMPVAA